MDTFANTIGCRIRFGDVANAEICQYLILIVPLREYLTPYLRGRTHTCTRTARPIVGC